MPSTFLTHVGANPISGFQKRREKYCYGAQATKYLLAITPSKLTSPKTGFLQFKELGPFKIIGDCMRIRDDLMHTSVDLLLFWLYTIPLIRQ
jgi:hypothetical protein